MMHCLLGIALLFVLVVGANNATAASPRRDALPAEQAVASFELHPELRIELVASEPQIVDPVSAAFDHLGRLWVVEMHDYPTGPMPGKPPGGKIKILTDEDDDGYYETSSVFADSLVFATGLMPFRQGVVATLAGEVVYLADTNGDGKCDTREKWFSGFSEDNEQLRANHPTWTLENQIHVASGLRGGEVRSADPRWPVAQQPLSLANRDFRFSPFGGNYQAVAGNSQFGFYQDDAGRNFVCSNRNPCRLLLAEAEQIANNPLLPIAQWIVDVMPAAEESQVFPLIDAWTTSNLHAGQFTAACGVYRYQSDWLSPFLKDDFFACEPTGSLVQRYRQTEDGIVPATTRGRADVEFLASRDPWFRPVDLLDGPDGGMYVVDMHRAVIEHPQWMPKELQGREDQRWGDAQGRIFRIIPQVGGTSKQQRVDFSSASSSDIVAALASENRWERSTAARRLVETVHRLASAPVEGTAAAGGVEQERMSMISALEHLVTAAAPGPAVSRALWLLSTFDDLSGSGNSADQRLTPELLAQAAAHADPDVRRQVIRLIGRNYAVRLKAGPLVAALASDSDARVRYQTLLELAPQADESLLDAIATAARYHRDNSPSDRQWIARAVSLTDAAVAPQLVQRLLEDARAGGRAAPIDGDKSTAKEADASLSTIAPLVKRLGWSGSAATLELLLSSAETTEIARTGKGLSRESLLLDEFAAGLAVRGQPWSSISASLSAPLRSRLHDRLLRDRQIVRDSDQPLDARVAALQRVGLDRSPETLALCSSIIEDESDDLYLEALQVVRHFSDSGLANTMVERIVQLPPRAATATVAALIGKSSWTSTLVDALAENEVPWGLIDPTSLRRLERHPDKAIAERVQALLAGRVNEDRDELLRRYTAALSGTPDLHAGRELFSRHCAGCHRIDNLGVAVGPDISDLRTQTPEQLLVAILDPNAAIDANYYRYLVLTDDGQVVEGLLEDNNQQSVTLQLQDGVRRTVPRSQIEQLRATGVSMMPEGFENQLSPEAMHHLIGYLKRWRLVSNEIPLGDK